MGATSGVVVRIVITGWALDDYGTLRDRGIFDADTYWEVLRPDIEGLRRRKDDSRFLNSHFWGPAQDLGGAVIPNGWKMKWHNLGPGRVQLRLMVALVDEDAFLCHAYVKTSAEQDRRQGAKLLARICLIREGSFDRMGEIS